MKVALVLGVIALCVAACGMRRHPVAGDGLPPAAEVSDEGRVSYAGLLNPGARWTFRIHGDVRTDGFVFDDVDFTADDATVDCWVAEAVDIVGGRAARVQCEEAFPDLSRNPLAGEWAETEGGLFKLATMPVVREHLALDPSDGYLSAHPVEREETSVDPADDEITEDRSTTQRVESFDEAWCAVYVYGATRGNGWRLCVAADGPVEGAWYWEDLYTIHSTFFRRVDRIQAGSSRR